MTFYKIMKTNYNNLFMYFILLIFFLITFYIYHNMDFDYIVADAKYYIDLANRIESMSAVWEFIKVNKNLVGILIYYDIILQESLLLFYIVTFSFFVYSVVSIYKNLGNEKNKNIILIFLLINPAIITTFALPNKEILGFISILFILNYIINKRLIYILLAIVFAIFTRFELVVLIIGYLTISKFNYSSKIIIIMLLLVLISIVVYYFDYSYFHMQNRIVSRDESLGIVSYLADLNQKGLYILTFPIKLLINLFGAILVFNPLKLDGYALNLYLSQLLMFVLTGLALINKSFSLRHNKYYLLFLLYSFIFTIPVYIQHRYFLPIYPVLVLLAFQSNSYNIK